MKREVLLYRRKQTERDIVKVTFATENKTSIVLMIKKNCYLLMKKESFIVMKEANRKGSK